MPTDAKSSLFGSQAEQKFTHKGDVKNSSHSRVDRRFSFSVVVVGSRVTVESLILVSFSDWFSSLVLIYKVRSP